MKKLDYYEICKLKLKYINYADNTISAYLFYINQFLNNIKVQPSRLNSNDFQRYLNNYSFTSVSQQNQVINAIRFLYKYGLNKKYDKVSFERPRKEKKLPRVIDKDFLLHKISKIKNLKHKTVICLAYSTGMRVSEIINLKIKDIDSDRMVINVLNEKGRKDRVVPLSRRILHILREYFMDSKPVTYLFNGQSSLKYSQTSCNKIIKKYIGSDYHFHLLRHSCFTALMESGVDLRIIQSIAGHNSSKTTEIYTHVSNNLLSKIPLPI